MSNASHTTESNGFSNIEMLSYFVFAWHILLFVISITFQRPIYSLLFIYFGYDHTVFQKALRDLISGIDPYQNELVTWPPMSIFMNFPLVRLSDLNAARVFFVFNGLCILFSLFLLMKTFALWGREKVLFVLATLCSTPFIMTMERGNLDGIMFLLVSSALYAGKRKYLPGIWIGLASALKVYPLIFIVPLLISKKWKAALALVIFILLSILLFPELYAHFLRNQIIRIGYMGLADNISFIAPLWHFSVKLGFSRLLGMSVGIPLMLLMGLLCVYYDFALMKYVNDKEKLFLFASYAVFCINFPELVYLYTGLMIFILLASSNSNELRTSRYYRYWLVLSSAFILFPAQSIAVTIGIQNRNHMIHFIPELGSALLLLYAVMVRRNMLNNIRGSLEIPTAAASVAT